MEKSTEEIKRNLSALSNIDLIRIIGKVERLRPEVISLLQEELINRSLFKEVKLLTDRLLELNFKQRNLKDLSEQELESWVDQRVKGGETLEKVIIDLKNQGINAFNLSNKSIVVKDRLVEYMACLKQEGYSELEIEQKLATEMELTIAERELLKSDFKQSAKANKIGGIILTLIGALRLTLIPADNIFSLLLSFLLIGLGVWRISIGFERHS